MSTINDGGPAFPQGGVWDGDRNQVNPVGAYFDAGGMTLRDYFAASALKGMEIPNGGEYSDNDHERGNPQREAAWIATQAYCMADAMLAAREAKP